jgi:transposase-like protein
MASPIAIAAALSRMTTIVCPHCGLKKVVERKPAHHRVCARCKKHYPDPLAASGRVKKK